MEKDEKIGIYNGVDILKGWTVSGVVVISHYTPYIKPTSMASVSVS
jgi:hypothetical protein